PEEPEFRQLSNLAAEVEPEFQQALMRLIDLPDTEGETFAPKVIDLSADASEVFAHFRQFAHVGKDALDGREREWWAKGTSHVLRLAGTLCFLDWAIRGGDEPGGVAGEFMTSAVELWTRYFWPHARAALRQAGISERHADARRALKWVRHHRR